MAGADVDEFVRRAEEVYTTRLRAILEPDHMDEFVAIEPDSGDYCLGRTLSDAIGAVRRLHPEKLAYGMRVGHKAAIHFGMHVR